MLICGAGPVFDKYGEKVLVKVGAVGLVGGLVGMSFCSCKYKTAHFLPS